MLNDFGRMSVNKAKLNEVLNKKIKNNSLL